MSDGRKTASNTRALFARQSERSTRLVIGGALAIGGSGALQFAGGLAGIGAIGALAVAIGVIVIAVAVIRGRRPVMIMEPTQLFLSREAQRIPFKQITKVAQLESNDVALTLQGGSTVLVPTSRLEDDDAAWLRKTLRREVRLAGT